MNPIASAQDAALRRNQLELEAKRARVGADRRRRPPHPRVLGAVAGTLRRLADRIDPRSSNEGQAAAQRRLRVVRP